MHPKCKFPATKGPYCMELDIRISESVSIFGMDMHIQPILDSDTLYPRNVPAKGTILNYSKRHLVVNQEHTNKWKKAVHLVGFLFRKTSS